MSIDIKTLHLRICLGAIALMAIVPFLMAHHYNPIPTFFQEWVAAALSLVALTALLQRRAGEPMEVPEIALLPIGLMLIAVLQWLFQVDALPDRLLMFSCYMVWTLFLVILGRHLARTFGLQTLADVLAAAIVVGALLEALSGAVQLAGMARMPWFFPATGGGLRGNLAQPNNFADYLWLGIGSAIYLRSRGALSTLSTVCSLSILLPFSVLSGSRSVWLYAIGVGLLSLAWAWNSGDRNSRTLRNWSLGALAGSLICQWAFSTGTVSLPSDVATSGARMAQDSYDPIRLILWRMAVNTFLENPWLGAGFGQYTRHFHLHVLDLAQYRLPGLPEHAHNILLNLLAEMGLVAGILLLVIVFRWARGLILTDRTPDIWWVCAMALVLGIHSNLEYPLWYGFFLSIAAVLAGAASQTNRALHLGRTAPYTITAVLLLGAVALQNAQQGYRLLEDTLNGRATARPVDERLKTTGDALRYLAEQSLLRPYVDLAIANLMTDDADTLDIKLQNCDRAQRFSASPDIVFKCAHILALAGRDDESKLALKRAVVAYPDRAEQVLERWKKRSPKEPSIARLVADFPPVAKRSPQ